MGDGFSYISPLRRMEDGTDVPFYQLPLSDEEIEHLFFWNRHYEHHDLVWYDCGTLEMPAYKELAAPDSETSVSGRENCRIIESKTGIPTYYYLKRYFGRKKNEDKRVCPSCGWPWRISEREASKKTKGEFHFLCQKCRLVSDIAPDTNERYARIGEFKRE
jgi:predicted  nucleic acid-binding Zn ribbon protein